MAQASQSLSLTANIAPMNHEPPPAPELRPIDYLGPDTTTDLKPSIWIGFVRHRPHVDPNESPVYDLELRLIGVRPDERDKVMCTFVSTYILWSRPRG